MEFFRSIIGLLALLLATINVTFGIYEDLIGKFDWKQSYVGKIKYASFDSIKRLVVATEENVVAALSLKSGNIHWRRVLEDPDSNQIQFLHVDNVITTVSGSANALYIRGWESGSGTLFYEWMLYPEKEAATDSQWIVKNDQLVHLVPQLGSHLQVTVYELTTGRNSGKTTQISAPWITDLSQCVTAGTYYVCLSDSYLYYIDVLAQDNKVYSFALEALIGNAPGAVSIKTAEHSEPSFLLVRNNVARFVKLQDGHVPDVLPYLLMPNVIVAPNGDQALLLQTVAGSNGQVQVRSKHLQEGSEETIDVNYDNEAGIDKVLAALCRGSACRMVTRNNDDSISLVQLPTGKVLWTREEALSHIVAAEFLELPVSDMDVSIEHEFDAADPIGMLYHRLSSQIRQLSVLLSPSNDASSSVLVRDEFGLHKLIIVVTKVGKLFALDSLYGDVVWSKFLPNVAPFVTLQKPTALLFFQRTARYTPLLPVCTLLVKDGSTGNGVLYSFDPITGTSEKGLQRLPYHVDQAMLLPYEDDNHLKGLLIYSQQGEVTLHPDSTKSVLLNHLNSIYFYVVSPDQAILKGYSLVHSTTANIKATPAWEVNLGGAQIVDLSVKPVAERVHSQGRVLADRSVLYKYVNPNLLAIAALMDDPLHKHVLSVYLIDGVTGLIVYSAYHKRVTNPIHLVHSENWLLYSYFNERFRRVEFAAVELYEGTTQSNSTIFSSLAISQLPHAESQSYIFPAQPVSMKVTHTERGITSKHVLVALSTGSVIEVPWIFLEPRGSFVSGNPEDGYVPYVPELPLPSDAAINYNQTLEHTRGLAVAPARLESTCLVLVHGLDLFYTRVTPSKTFDLLKEDFDHWLIVVVLAALLVASYVTKRLASRKALKQAWK